MNNLPAQLKLTALTLLIYAKAKIAKKENWTQGALSRNIDGVPVLSTAVSACKWCSRGAISAICPDLGQISGPRIAALVALQLEMGESITRFNDTHTHEEVMEAWDRAIDTARIAEQSRKAELAFARAKVEE